MKKYLLFLMVLFTGGLALAQDRDINIDAQDTVVFDLSMGTQASGTVEFPVYFLSNDTVVALDFNFRYNTGSFRFDSIQNLTSYLFVISHENIDSTTTHDTTVYCSAYMQASGSITNDTPVVKIYFTSLTGAQFCSSHLTYVEGLLNGDACSESIIINCVPTGIEDHANIQNITGIYPNPATDNTVIEFSLAAKSELTISVHDITGKTVYETTPSQYRPGSHKVNLNLAGLENGVYIVRIKSENESKSTRISVIR